MATQNIGTLKKRIEGAWSDKGLWDDQLEEAYKFCLPQRDQYDNPTKGQKKNTHLFDSTGVSSTRKSASKFVNLMFPAFRKWAKIQAGPKFAGDKDQIAAINEKLEKVTEVMFSIMHNRSNFQSAIGETALDLIITTGVLSVQKGTLAEPVDYRAVPQIQVALEQGPQGTVGGVFRKFEIPAGIIQPTWPDAKLSKDILAAVKDEPDKKFKLDEAFYTDYKTGELHYDVIATGDTNDRIVERDMRRNPYVVGRLIKAANEVQGRGFALEALPDIKTLNKLVELTLKDLTLAVSGVYTVTDDGVVNPDNISIAPLTFIPVARNSGHPAGPSIAPLPRTSDFNVSFIEQERLQNNIKRLLLNEELPDLTGQPRTAQEIIQRMRIFVDELGATFGRISREMVNPIIQNTIDILEFDFGLIEMPKNPDGSSMRIDGDQLELVITSPLAMQQSLNEIEALTQTLEISRAMFGPQATAIAFEMEEIPGWIGRKLGVDETLIRDKNKRQGLEQDIATAIAEIEGNKPGAGLGLVTGAVAGQ